MELATPSHAPPPPPIGALAAQMASSSSQFITCTLGEAEYGIDIMSVREIKGWTETTSIPYAPPWIRGVINLRGTIVPILDLRARFRQEPTVPTPMHHIIHLLPMPIEVYGTERIRYILIILMELPMLI